MNFWEQRYKDSIENGKCYNGLNCWSWEIYLEETNVLKNILKRFLKDKYINVLDYGCGTGRFAELFENYTGIDIVYDMIEDNRRSMPDKTFYMPHEYVFNDIIDLMFCFTLIQHLQDMELIKLFHTVSKYCLNIFVCETAVCSNEYVFYRDNQMIKNIFSDIGYSLVKENEYISQEKYRMMLFRRHA